MRVQGTWETGTVKVNGKKLDPAYSRSVWNHSEGFSWGYAGSGPAQLALALLLKAGFSKELAIRLHQFFKVEIIEGLPQDDFETEIDPIAWSEEREARYAHSS